MEHQFNIPFLGINLGRVGFLTDIYPKNLSSLEEVLKGKYAQEKRPIYEASFSEKNKDIFFKPIDIGDNTIPNGNAIMLINLVKLGMIDEAQKLSESLNGYLNIYKNHMMTALRALDFFNKISKEKNCNEQGCTTKD